MTDARREVVLTTPRLTLTTWLAGDVDELLEVHADPETMRYVRSGRPESRDEVELLVDQYIAEHDAQGWARWRVVDRTGLLVGRAGFAGEPDDRGLGYTLRRSHWGLGLATELTDALVGWHLAHAPGVRLHALVAVGNDASARVLRKTGFVELGTEDHHGTPCRSFVHPATDPRAVPPPC